MKIAISAVLFLLVSFAQAAPRVERKLYVGKDSAEATMTFRAAVEITATRTPSDAKVLEVIQVQLNHLFGPMGEAKQKAVPKGDQEISVVSVEKKEDAENIFVATYAYEGTIVIKVPAGGLKATYPIVLPINPGTIYAAGAVRRGSNVDYPCTDDHYTSEGDFWYFWNPKKPGCPLRENRDYVRIDAKVKKRANSRVTYPEYANLVDDANEIRVSLLIGMDEPTKGRNPLTSQDTNAKNYRDVADSLEKKGFARRRWTKDEISRVVGDTGEKAPFVEEFTKTAAKATLKLRLFFGPSGIDEESSAFHHFFKDALENASVMIYDGHSGLGGHLDLASIEQTEGFRITPPRNKYQIYFFNSCSSYSYYNTMFFGRKATERDPRGTKQLDILTNGLATYFYVTHNTNMELINAIDAWAADKGSVSYQAIAKKIDSGNLFGVNGDEDNPTRP